MKKIYVEETDLNKLNISEDCEVILTNKEYTLSKVLCIEHAVTIQGNGAVIKGAGSECGFYIKHSDTVIRDMTMIGFVKAIDIDADGGTAENITVENVDIDLDQVGIQIGSSHSDSVLRGITLKNCRFRIFGTAQWEQDEIAARVPVMAGAAVARSHSERHIENCLLEDFLIENVRTVGETRIAVNVMNGVCDSFYSHQTHDNDYENCIIRNIKIINCHFDTCWDSPFNFSVGFEKCTGSRMENLEIAWNNIRFGISGLYLWAGEPLWGDSIGTLISGVSIHNNIFTRGVADVGEPSRGLYIGATRSDYYSNMVLKDNTLENVEIYENIFDGAGPCIVACYAMLDGHETYHENNVTRNITITRNRILNADVAFSFKAAEAEGRLHDWNFGYPRHDKQWEPLLKDDSEITCRFINNRIENLSVTNNEVIGYRYRVIAEGAKIRGHGYAENNCVSEGITFAGNTFSYGENHIRISDFAGEDWSHDGGDNKVSDAFYNADISA